MRECIIAIGLGVCAVSSIGLAVNATNTQQTAKIKHLLMQQLQALPSSTSNAASSSNAASTSGAQSSQAIDSRSSQNQNQNQNQDSNSDGVNAAQGANSATVTKQLVPPSQNNKAVNSNRGTTTVTRQMVPPSQNNRAVNSNRGTTTVTRQMVPPSQNNRAVNPNRGAITVTKQLAPPSQNNKTVNPNRGALSVTRQMVPPTQNNNKALNANRDTVTVTRPLNSKLQPKMSSPKVVKQGDSRQHLFGPKQDKAPQADKQTGTTYQVAYADNSKVKPNLEKAVLIMRLYRYGRPIGIKHIALDQSKSFQLDEDNTKDIVLDIVSMKLNKKIVRCQTNGVSKQHTITISCG